MPYEFRILGPVALTRDGHPVPPGPPKRRALMAALLLDANRPVPLSSLTSAMWAGPPPASAKANLRTHVSALRGALGDRLVARPRAYELRVEDAELDASEFARLARAGRRALAAGEPATAIVQLGAALALWRGAAADGLPRGTSLDARLVALDEQRLEVIEEHLQARLHTRAYPEIAADLRAVLAESPVRERLWELLMVALYRSGNAAGALAAYREARATLRDQLGIEPGTGLQRLQRAILHRDPSLDGAPAPASVTATTAPQPPEPPPHRLPPATVELVGRSDELAALLTMLRHDRDTVLVVGRAGMGKSALAAHAARHLTEDFPDGLIAFSLDDAGSPQRPHDLVAAVLRALGVPADQLPPSLDERAALYRSTTSGRRVLVLLDGVTSQAQLQPLTLTGGTAAVLATSRRRPATLDGARCLELGPLPEVDGVSLVTAHAGAGRAGSDPASVRELVRVCDGLPLALRIVGERLARRPQLPPAMLAAHLTTRPLDGLRVGELSVREAFDADYRTVAAVDPVAARALPLLGRLESGVTATPESLTGPLGEDPSRVFHALEELVDAWLAESPRPGHYRTAGLVHAYAAELAKQ